MSMLKSISAIVIGVSMATSVFANEEKVDISEFFDKNSIQMEEVSFLSQEEMKETEGSASPLVYAAVVAVGRGGLPYIIKGAQVTQAQAINILRNGGSIITNAQYYASQLAKTAWGASSVIQHEAHKAYDMFMPHYQNISNKINGHSFWK